MEKNLKILEKYDFKVPKELIAQKPVKPRDAAKLLVFERKTGKTRHDIFRHLPKYLPPGALLVFNDTKVIPARFEVKKETGGKAVLLYIEKNKVISDRKLTVGQSLKFSAGGGLKFKVIKQENQFYYLQSKNLEKLLEKYGEAPVPPYIKRKSTREDYQTIFAKTYGAIAAPTASLHFTKSLLQKISHKAFVTLHVGLGTFAPLTDRNLKNNKLHEEKYEISKKTWQKIQKAKKAGLPVIAVGTTVVRALESLAVEPLNSGSTALFIRPGYKFKVIDGLITNFHVPKSSLMMLVSALVGREKLLELYNQAINRRYRLFSFGDGMLIL